MNEKGGAIITGGGTNIKPSNDIVVPAVAEKTADGYWLTNLELRSPVAGQKIRLSFRLVPYNSSDGEMFRELGKPVTIDDLYTFANGNADLTAAIDNFFTLVNDLAAAKGVL